MTDPWIQRFEERRREREQAERSFELLGETWHVRATVAPEVAITYGALQRRLAEYAERVQQADKAGEPLPTDSGISDEELLQISEETIRACLAPESIPTWERVRAPDFPDPLGLFDIYGFASYVLARASGFPTGAPTGSSNGRSPTGPSSKAASPSPARPRQARKR